MPPLDYSYSHPVDQAAAQHLSSASPDCSFAREVQSQVSASMAHPLPGAESMMSAPGMPGLVPGADQAISPLVQMIMRMPGHIGLASSFFEALGNFFLPQTDLLALFDPSHFGLHIDLSGALPTDHSAIDLSLLPHGAPLLDHLGSADLSSAHSLDLASDKLNISLGGHGHLTTDSGSASLSMGSKFNVSGQVSFSRPQFEGAGGLVSGPSLSENLSTNSLASNNRLFSDGAGISSAGASLAAPGGTASGMLTSPSLTQSASASSLGSSTGLGSSSLAASTVNNSALADNVSSHVSSANNVSYNALERLTGNRDLLAASNASDSYHSMVGTIQSDAGSDALTRTSSGHSDTPGNDNLGGLKAKSMSLDGSRVELKPDHKLDHSDHQAKATEPRSEHRPEHKIEQKAESSGSSATKSPKTVDQISHQTVKPTSQPAHQPVNAQSTKVSPADTVAAHVKTASIDSKHAAIESKHVASESKHIATESKHVASESKHIATESKHVSTESKHIATESKHVSTESQPAASIDSTASSPVTQEQIVQGQNIQASHGQNEVAQTTAQNDAEKQFGEPIKSSNDAAGNTGSASHAQGTNSQTLEQQQAPVTAKTYTIRSGDCLWNIAKDQLGDAAKWSDIYKMNGDVLGANPSLIHPGVSIQLPGAETAGAGSIAHYIVKPGDNLWDIAKNQMGDATKWGDLYKANHDIIGSNPDLIRPGQELTINTGTGDPSGAQLSSTGTGASTNLAQAPDPAHAAPAGSAPVQHPGGDLGKVSQNSQQIDTYGDKDNAMQPTLQKSSEINFEAAPMSHNIQAPQAPSAASVKVMPVEAQPDAIIQPAHAADMTNTAGPPEAANAAGAVAHSQKGGMVNTSVGSDLMSFLNKRR